MACLLLREQVHPVAILRHLIIAQRKLARRDWVNRCRYYKHFFMWFILRVPVRGFDVVFTWFPTRVVTLFMIRFER